ncbi:hypothetical protein EK21DRAFT_93191 [Setomelanomma holmii]|uniref:F-box domain-containing protein n=1 Tax=Setomelanomma holmii TaxID=210430 RepID=A0A9P4H1D1_9PLEO|nr:hypothetical protein EK21DRAFT_93191 [Setomelanomma holmii]
MPTLTTIPRELRDNILGYVIQSDTDPRPDIHSTFDDLIQGREILKEPKLGSWCTTVLYHPETPIANTYGALLTNRQLRSETLENIQRLNANECNLDVIIVEEILPLPTWTRVVAPSTRLDKVNVTFRISGRWHSDKERHTEDGVSVDGPYTKYGYYKGFKIGDGAGPAMSWQVYSILERFIKIGYIGKCGDGFGRRCTTVKTININVETPPDIDPSEFGFPLSSRHSRRYNPTVLEPKYLANFIDSNISGLLCSQDHEWFGYGKILFQNVDVIRISLDGQLNKEYDVAECLKNAGGFKAHYIPTQKLRQYRKETWKERKERGLKLLEE